MALFAYRLTLKAGSNTYSVGQHTTIHGITGTVTKLFETRNFGWAIIREDGTNRNRPICLG